MSVNLDPNNQPTAPNNPPPFAPSFPCPLKLVKQVAVRWADLLHEATLKEILPAKVYCERAWEKETGRPASEITELYMQTCTEECRSFRAWNHWSRYN